MVWHVLVLSEDSMGTADSGTLKKKKKLIDDVFDWYSNKRCSRLESIL